MRLFALTILTMLAFAANSLLNRAALLGEGMDPASFALIRVAAGAVMLMVLLRLRAPVEIRRPQPLAVLGLVAYLLGFSYAYTSMDAGVGALILFAGVQITMFAGALRAGENLPLRRWIGALAALSGLVFLLWPRETVELSGPGFALMSLAAVGWGIYSLIGRNVQDPLEATAWNFLYSFPMVALFYWGASPVVIPVGMPLGLALISGAITSGLGYALWYAVLPKLGAAPGALAQLSVPVLALGMGALFLGEQIASHTVLAAMIVLTGIAIGSVRFKKT